MLSRLSVHVCAFTLFTFHATVGFGHGEDRPGPHGGFIRMPGAYHTEVVPGEKGILRVYLLDMEWKNPITEDSQVRAELNPGTKKARSTVCRPKGDHFQCEFPPQTDFRTSGDKLVIESTRKKQKGHMASYDLPFSLQKPVPSDHSGHSEKDPHAGH